MKNNNRLLVDYLKDLEKALLDAQKFISNLSLDDFIENEEKQYSVVMCLIIIGEVSARIMEKFPKFSKDHPEIPWLGMRNMRNRVAHGYFEIDYNLVWETIKGELPLLQKQLPALIEEVKKSMT